ncbi:MAG TPA: hypothetical protein PLM70_08695 [Bacteroidales bacterium]|nr:hypothetical protein [Bacteroidales bacterium]
MIAFSISDENGLFKTKINVNADSLIVKISSINYRNESRIIPNTSQYLRFELTLDVKQLDSIIVQGLAIEKHGDTLSYLVQSFTKTEDRSIEDVLRRMPGIEVGSGGEILYQNIPINKFYVEGLDLMEGRYSIISKNLPQGSVSTVDILENHQPIRMLQDKVDSQQAAINLKLKKVISSTGTAQLGTGFSPLLWNVNVSPMTFSKNFQVISSWQANNTGNDVSQQLKVLTLDELSESKFRPLGQEEMLNVVTANPPEIKQSRYLFNNIHLINFNGICRITPEDNLRTNIFFVSNKWQAKTTLLRTVFTPGDTLSFREQSDYYPSAKYLLGNFSLNRNAKKNYLNNELKFQTSWDKEFGVTMIEGKSITQFLNNPARNISNNLRTFSPLGKYYIELHSSISYDCGPQNLEIKPGVFESVLNNSLSIKSINQIIDLKRFYTENSAGIVACIKHFTILPKIGICYEQQNLSSKMLLEKSTGEIQISPESINNLEYKYLDPYANTTFEFKKSKLTFKNSFFFDWHNAQVIELTTGNRQFISKFLFNYHTLASYDLNSFLRLSCSWNKNNHLSNFEDIHYNYILSNYQSLSKNNAPISIISTRAFSSYLSYRNQIISFFNKLSYIYSINLFDNLTNNLLQPDGTIITINNSQPRKLILHSLQLYSSKYLPVIKTTLNLHINYIQQRSNVLTNNMEFETKNQTIVIRPEFSFRLAPWMNLDYGLDANKIFSYVNSDNRIQSMIIKHILNFFIFPEKNQLLSFTSEYYKLNSKNNTFIDILYRYTFTKQKIDVELQCNNILNTSSYTSFLVVAGSLYETTYQMRPFQVIFSVRLSF